MEKLAQHIRSVCLGEKLKYPNNKLTNIPIHK